MNSGEYVGNGGALPKLTSMCERSRACDRLLAYIQKCISLAEASGEEEVVALLSTVQDRVRAMRPATLH